jgi:septal ring factor EnvC (AmiA/AmiB activator)
MLKFLLKYSKAIAGGAVVVVLVVLLSLWQNSRIAHLQSELARAHQDIEVTESQRQALADAVQELGERHLELTKKNRVVDRELAVSKRQVAHWAAMYEEAIRNPEADSMAVNMYFEGLMDRIECATDPEGCSE